MAQTNVYFDENTKYGRLLRKGLNQLEEGPYTLNQVIASMSEMVTGDGTDSSQFDEVTLRFGFDNNTDAKAAWDEIQSCMAKLNTNDSVTSVLAARSQLVSRLR